MSIRRLWPPAGQRAASEHSVEANARMTGAAAVVLLPLFCVEVATVLMGVRSVLTLHVVIGLLLVPPLLVKIASVSWRFFQYYRHDDAYRRRGAPVPALRMLGPVLLFATLVLFVSGITLLLAPSAFAGHVKQIHSISFYVWLLAVLASLAAGLALALSLVGHVGTYRHDVSPVRRVTQRVPAAPPGSPAGAGSAARFLVLTVPLGEGE
jgi:hypothetical protein